MARQRQGECALASACVVAGVDYETASDLFELLHGDTWWPRSGPASPWAKATWLPFLREWVDPRAQESTLWSYPEDVSGESARPSSRTRFVVISTVGMSHVMAYADGVVEDSAYDVSGTLEEVMAKYYPGWVVDRYVE